jgi:fucose 4-O-acetylase-like acetyltransferase
MEKKRIQWIDNGKAVSIYIIFLAHIFEGFVYKSAYGLNTPFERGVISLNFLSNFIIPFFFFMSGYVANVKQRNFKEYFIKKFSTIMIPMYIFNIISLILFLVVRTFYDGLLVEELRKYGFSKFTQLLLVFFAGIPSFNFPTWFLTCLFTTTLIFYFTYKVTKDKTKQLLIFSIFFAVVGYLMEPIKNNTPGFNYIMYFWFIPTAFTSTAFYLFGYLSRKFGFFEIIENKNALKITVFSISLIILLTLTYFFNFNRYPEYEHLRGGPYMNHLVFGNYFVFYATAICGIFMSVSFSMFFKKNKLMDFIGLNTLYLLGFIGIFYQFTTGFVAYLYINFFIDKGYLFFISYCVFFSFLQLLLSLLFMKPVASIINYSVNFIQEKLTTIFA